MKTICSAKILSIGLIFIGTSVLDAKTINIVIASDNQHKVAAVERAFTLQFPQETIQVFPYAVASGVPAQPIGSQVAECGARNRLSNLPTDIVHHADYVVALENFIEQVPSGSWCDKGLLIMQDMRMQRELVCCTAPTFFPTEYMLKARELSGIDGVHEGGFAVTVGEAIASSFIDREVDTHNWHQEPEFGGVSREQLLADCLYKMLNHDQLELIKSRLAFHPNFPKPGILFVDMFPMLADAHCLHTCIDILAARYASDNIQVIVGLESRGFIVGAALAYKLGAKFVPVRKPGKLPGAVIAVTYEKEYGSDTLTIAQAALAAGERVLIVDDLIATGGSARAAIALVQQAGGVPVEFVTLLQVPELAELARLSIPAFNLID